MATVNHDYIPGDAVFVVVEETCVKSATVLQFEYLTYLDVDDVMQERKRYLVSLGDDTSEELTPEFVFGTLVDALNKVSSTLVPTPTPTSSVTPTPTPTSSVTPTPTPTPSPSV